jgi:voltage-gated potassium channel
MPTLERPLDRFPRFWERRSVRHIVGGLIALLMVIILSTTGYVFMGWKVFDAFYMVVITISTVGYGEVQPLTTVASRVHTMVTITLGTIAVAYTIGGFVQFLAEGEFQQFLGHHRMRRQIETLSDHTIVVGFGRVGSLVCKDLTLVGLPFVVIENSHEKIDEIERLGYLFVMGDGTDEKVLQEAGLTRAKVLITAMPSDAETVFITLSARQMAPRVMIVARAEQPSTFKKLVQAGADHIVLPSSIGARRIVSLVTNPSAVDFVELITQRFSLEIEMDDIPIHETSSLKGQSLRNANIGRLTGVIVIAIKRSDGRLQFPPTGNETLEIGDKLVILGRRANIEQFRREFVT